MRRLLLVVVALVSLGFGSAAAQGEGPGIYVDSSTGSTELKVWAEMRKTGVLGMINGTIDDAPVITGDFLGIRHRLPNFRPLMVVAATRTIFEERTFERRSLPIAMQRVNLRAVNVRVKDLEQLGRVVTLARDVKATADSPALFFIVIQSGNLNETGVEARGGIAAGSISEIRYYPFRLAVEASR